MPLKKIFIDPLKPSRTSPRTVFKGFFVLIMAKTTIDSKYGVTPNELLNSKELSLRAKGLFAYIQSKPDNWDFSVEKIALQCKENEGAIAPILKELEAFGYLQRVKYHDEKGHWAIEYVLYSTPQPESTVTVISHERSNPITAKCTNISKKDSLVKKNISKEHLKISCEILPLAKDYYYNFFKNKTGSIPNLNGSEINALKLIINYFKSTFKEKGGGGKTEKDHVLDCLAYLFKNWQKLEPFIQNQLKLTQINSNLTNIINQLKNGTFTNTTKSSSNTVARGQESRNELLAKSFAKIIL